MLRMLGMRFCSRLGIVEPIKHDCGLRAAERGLHEASGGGDAAGRARDNDGRIGLPDEFALDGHELVAAFLAIELASLRLMRLPAAQHFAQELN